jgi:hypothetical protein
MKEIKLTRGKVALVDDEDFEYLNQWKWFFNKGYAGRHTGPRHRRKLVLMHRDILCVPDGLVTDHINHDGLDNRRSNLRSCTRAQNYANSDIHSNNTSGAKGVRLRKDTKKWSAIIKHNQKVIYLGCFKNLDEAARAYKDKAREIYGEFAYNDKNRMP